MENEILQQILKNQELLLNKYDFLANGQELLLKNHEALAKSQDTLLKNHEALARSQELMFDELKDIRRDLGGVKLEVSNIKQQQQKDSQLLQDVFNQTVMLTEHKTETDAKFKKFEAAL
ncbi:MAG: hypothetical protein LBU94_01675 [Clostridiales bacterium]|nr:hypothetical protein [Clostridiales bacterium]